MKRLRKLPVALRSAALREGLLAAANVQESDLAGPLSWALVELAALPAVRVEGPWWSPVRWWAQRRVRESDAALAAIAGCWTVLGEDVRKAAMGVGEDRWEQACRSALRDRRPAVRVNVATLVAQSGEAALAGLASELVSDPLEAAARQAELAFVALAVQARRARWSREERRAWDHARETSDLWGPVLRPTSLRSAPKADEYLASGLLRALETFEDHRRRGVLLSIILLCDRAFMRGVGGEAKRELLRVVGARDHAVNGPLMSMLRARALPTGRLRALEWLHMPAARRGAAARLARAESTWDHELVLSAGHLCLRPLRREVLRTIGITERGRSGGASTGALPGSGVARALSTEARRMLPLWSTSIKATAPQRHAALAALLGDEDPTARLAAIRHGPASLLIDQVLDVDARVSRTAYLAWGDSAEAWKSGKAGADAERSRLLALFSRLPHPSVRTLAAMDRGHDADPFSPALSVASPEGVTSAYRALAENRAQFITELSARLASTSVHTWCGAIHLARRLMLVPEVEPLLHAIAMTDLTSADAVRAVAQAISALGDVATTTSGDVLRQSLNHTDARVRANAVEALAKQRRLRLADRRAAGEREHADLPGTYIFELKSDPHHRVRANAIRAAIMDNAVRAARAGQRHEDRITEIKNVGAGAISGAESLASILSDDRTMHRLAGAWVAWKTLGAAGPLRLHARWPDLVTQVGDMARNDPEPRVRLRAARCAQMIESSMSTVSLREAATMVGGMMGAAEGAIGTGPGSGLLL